jgi:hypothetical protein
LDRGLEDGIQKRDNIKLTNEFEGYASRAICIRASANTSYWKLYRIPNTTAFSKDYTYTITSYGDREIPSYVQDFYHAEKNITENEKKKHDSGEDPFQFKNDLPERLTERDLLEITGPEKRKLYVEQVLNKDQLKRDLKDYRLSLYASPFTRQSINDGESLRYGFRGGNVASKYRLLTQFEKQQTKLKDPVTKESVSTSSTSGQVQFVVHQIKSGLSTLSMINYQATKFSALGTPKSHWQAGPIGLTWHFYESKTWEYMDLSYIPLYDTRETEVLKTGGGVETVKTNGLRHGIRLGVKTRINERVAFENLLWVRPFQDLSSWAIESDNLNLVNDAKFIFNLSGNLYFDYNFIYQKDKLWKSLSNLPETNIINSLNLRYDFDI